jgi:hypothetical protein
MDYLMKFPAENRRLAGQKPARAGRAGPQPGKPPQMYLIFGYTWALGRPGGPATDPGGGDAPRPGAGGDRARGRVQGELRDGRR